jgi:hypothetical protein
VARLAEVRDLGFLVEARSDAVPDELADDRKPRGLDVRLDRVADVGDPLAGARLFDREAQCLAASESMRPTANVSAASP